MTPITTKHDKTIEDYNKVFADIAGTALPKSPLPGSNFMTPEVLGAWKHGDRYIELSTGNWPTGEGLKRIFGISIRSESDLSKSIYGSLVEANTMEEVRLSFDATIDEYCH